MILQTELGYKVIPINKFISDHHNTVTTQTVRMAIEAGHIDSVQPARDIFVVLSPKTLAYKPRTYGSRRP